MIKKIKQSKIKKGDGHLGHLPAYLPGPAPPAGPAHHHSLPVVFLPGQEDEGVCPTLAGTRARHLPPAGHLLLPPDSLDAPDEATQLPRTALTLPRPPLLPLLSLPLTREPPPPPTGITVATASPSPPRRPQELRLVGSYLLAEPRKPECPVEPSPSPNSTPAAVDPRRELPGIPDLALALAGSAVSPRTEPPPPRVRLRRLGLSSAMAEARLRSSLSPALLRRPFGHASAPSTLAAPCSAPLAL